MMDVVLGIGDRLKSGDKKGNDDDVVLIKSMDNEISVKLPVGHKIKEIYLSPYLSKLYILLRNDACYVWSEPSKPLEILKNCDGEEIKVEKMDVGSKEAVIISKNNELLMVNVQQTISRRIIPTFTTKILSVSCGNEHSILLSESGQIYTFGAGSKGQLGHGSTTFEEQPKVVEALDGLKIMHISAGGWHSAAISDIGDLYIWGWNKFGQLGLGDDTTTSFLPHLVSFGSESSDDFGAVIVKTVDCGSCHTVALTDGGKVWGWGWNAYGQLGSGSRHEVHTPILLDLTETLGSPLKIQAQYWTTVVSFCKTD